MECSRTEALVTDMVTDMAMASDMVTHRATWTMIWTSSLSHRFGCESSEKFDLF